MNSKKPMFQQNFKKNCTISTGILHLAVWYKNDSIGHLESELEKKSDSGS